MARGSIVPETETGEVTTCLVQPESLGRFKACVASSGNDIYLFSREGCRKSSRYPDIFQAIERETGALKMERQLAGNTGMYLTG